MWIYRMYVTAPDGHKVYRKNGRPFRFWVDDPKEANI